MDRFKSAEKSPSFQTTSIVDSIIGESSTSISTKETEVKTADQYISHKLLKQ